MLLLLDKGEVWSPVIALQLMGVRHWGEWQPCEGNLPAAWCVPSWGPMSLIDLLLYPICPSYDAKQAALELIV